MLMHAQYNRERNYMCEVVPTRLEQYTNMYKADKA